MQIDVVALLRESGMLLLFTVMGLGYLLGRVRIAGIEGGPVVGVLLTALVFGHFGFDAPAGASTFGFSLFIFSVGIQAGPTFFSSFKADGTRYIALALVVAASALALAKLLDWVLGLPPGFGAGLLAGALTSTPTLAGAQDAVTSGLAALPEGVSPASAREAIGVGYAITYIFATVATILLVRLVPRRLGLDLPAAAAALARERGIGKRRSSHAAGSMPVIRAYEAPADLAGKTIAQVRAEHGGRGRALKLRRNGQLLDLEPELVIQAGDIFSIIADVQTHAAFQQQGATEILDGELLDFRISRREIVIANPEVFGSTLGQLNLSGDYGCFATDLVRTAITLPLDPDLPLEKGDRLEVAGEAESLTRLASRLGFVEQEVQKTDLATFAFGLIAGILLGMVMVKLGNFSVGLGSAGGLLVSGIVIGYLGSVMPTFGRVPAPARMVLMELGLMIFMAAVGLHAGGGVVDALFSQGPFLVVGGVLVTLGTAALGYGFGRYVLRMNPALLLGSLTGAMTSTPALNVVQEAARSAVPALGYAGTYTFANVMLTFAGTLMMVL